MLLFHRDHRFRNAVLLIALSHPSWCADDQSPITTPAAPPAKSPSLWSWLPPYTVHAQSTMIMLKHDSFPSAYQGTNSLLSEEPKRTSLTGTLFFGMPLWRDAEGYLDPEIAGGEGPSGVVGMAGQANGETPRVSTPEPQPYIARAFIRQYIDLGGPQQDLPDAVHQLSGKHAANRLQITAGKLAANDIFDTNTYSHDPRSQFSNWSLWENGAWDYPADTRGYTWGFAAECYLNDWVYRIGAFMVPDEANGAEFDPHLRQALSTVAEIEHDHVIGTHPGAIRVLTFLNKTNGGRYADAIALAEQTQTTPDITTVRSYSVKYGFGLNLEQELTTSLGCFARLGWNDGNTESWMFTEIDRSVNAGFQLKGIWWDRGDDVLGIAGAVNGISQAHRDYLARGGYGFIIGDGALDYQPEAIVEAYYTCKMAEHIFVAPSTQYVRNPAYNHDRGPVVFLGLRIHLDL